MPVRDGNSLTWPRQTAPVTNRKTGRSATMACELLIGNSVNGQERLLKAPPGRQGDKIRVLRGVIWEGKQVSPCGQRVGEPPTYWLEYISLLRKRSTEICPMEEARERRRCRLEQDGCGSGLIRESRGIWHLYRKSDVAQAHRLGLTGGFWASKWQQKQQA